MTEQFRPHAEIKTALPEDIQALGYLGVGGAMQTEAGIKQGAENIASIAESANYQGNWMIAQQERMADQTFKAKYDRMVDESLPSLKEGTPGVFDKPEKFQGYHQTLVDTFD